MALEASVFIPTSYKQNLFLFCIGFIISFAFHQNSIRETMSLVYRLFILAKLVIKLNSLFSSFQNLYCVNKTVLAFFLRISIKAILAAFKLK